MSSPEHHRYGRARSQFAELETAAKEKGVVFVKGTDFLLEGGGNTLRLAYSGVTPEEIDTGITRLAEAVRSLVPTSGSRAGR